MIKLYMAILNQGWFRREITSKILPMMNRTKGVRLFLENPSKSFANQISVNRNRIVKRFLKTDCDFLLMMDDDIVPMHNPAELVFANKDIIGSPARVRQSGKIINWVAYVKHPESEGYVGIDRSKVSSDIDLLAVDVVGTGCILVRRNVLEKLKAPFHCEYDEDGDCTFGTDFAFCRKAKKEGFEIYTTPWRVCEHIKKNIGLNDIDSYDFSDFHNAEASKYRMTWGHYSICQKDWVFIKDILQTEGIDNVLEFGAGLSSLLMSETCNVDSLEVDEKYAGEILKHRIFVGNQAINKLNVMLWNGESLNGQKLRDRYDLAFVDGPLGKVNGGTGRENSIRIAAEKTDRIIVHDAGRTDESHWQDKYLRPGYVLKSWSGAHQSRCNYWVKK